MAWKYDRVCFVAGTHLRTPDGSKPIEQFRVGDQLLSRDEYNVEGAIEVKTVEEVFIRFGRVLHLHVGGQVIGTTAEHPFYVRDKGWLPAGELVPGDLRSSHDGQWTPVEEVFDTGETATVYNLRIADFHTYFVGCDEWGLSVWAHNTYQERLGATTVAGLETHRANLGISHKEWHGIFGSAFRGRPWAETAATRLRTSLVKRVLSVAQIDDVVTTAFQRTRLADPNAGANIDLLSRPRAVHVLDGDATGGGHRFGTGSSGKTEFPAWWTDARIKDAISSTYVDASRSWYQQSGPLAGTMWAGPGAALPAGVTSTGKAIRFRTDVVIDGVHMRVIAEPGPGNLGLVGGYPLSGRGVFRNP